MQWAPHRAQKSLKIYARRHGSWPLTIYLINQSRRAAQAPFVPFAAAIVVCVRHKFCITSKPFAKARRQWAHFAFAAIGYIRNAITSICMSTRHFCVCICGRSFAPHPHLCARCPIVTFTALRCESVPHRAALKRGDFPHYLVCAVLRSFSLIKNNEMPIKRRPCSMVSITVAPTPMQPLALCCFNYKC